MDGIYNTILSKCNTYIDLQYKYNWFKVRIHRLKSSKNLIRVGGV